MHFADYTVILVLALVLFGPKKLPEIARTIGKVMAELRRASNEFRSQIDDEMRVMEQQERQKKLEASAAANATPALAAAESSPEHDIPEHHIEDGIEQTADLSAERPVVVPPSIGETVSVDAVSAEILSPEIVNTDTDWMPVAPAEMIAAAEVEPHPVYAEALAAEQQIEQPEATNHNGAHTTPPAEAPAAVAHEPTQADAPESAQVTASHG